MTLVWHHLCKDIRHVRWGLFIWGILLALQAGVMVTGSFEVDEVTRTLLLTLGLMVPAFQLIFLALLIPWVLQDEPAVGTTAFWFTRPLTPGLVLASKAIFVLAAILLPKIAIELLVMGLNGVESQLVALAIPETALGTLAAVLPLAAVAAMTPNMGRYMLWLAGGFFLAAVLSTLLIYGLFYVEDGDLDSLGPGSATLASSSQIAASLIYLFGGAGVVVWQYFTRQTLASLVALALLILIAFNTSVFWKFDFFAQPLPSADERQIPSGNVFTHADPRSLHLARIPSLRARDEQKQELSLALILEGLPAGLVGSPLSVQSTAKFDDGTIVSDFLKLRGCNLNQETLAQALVPALLPGVRRIGMIPGSTTLTKILRLPEAEAARLAEIPCSLGLTAEWALLAGELQYRLPLRIGADFRDGPGRETIRSFTRLGQIVELTLLVRSVNLLFAPPPGGWALGAGEEWPVIYGLFHPTRNELLLARPEMDLDAALAKEQKFSIRARRIRFEWQGQKPSPLDDSWLAEAELIRIGAKPVAHLKQSIMLENIRLSGAR